MHSSIGTEDPELERALNFNTVSVMCRDKHDEESDQMVPERDSSNTMVVDSNEEYFNQWISSFKQ